MSKFTRRLKKKNNKTKKRGGGNEKESDTIKDRKGVVDIVEDKLSNVATSAAKTLSDAGLKIIGLERVNKTSEEEQNNAKVDETINKIGNTTAGIVSDVDKTGASIIENVNEVLGSDAVKQTTEQAAENTATIVKNSAEKFNEALNNPEVKAEVEGAIENLGELSSVVIESAKEPFNKAVDVATDATQKVTSAALSGAVKVGTDVLAAVPFVGAFFDLGKIVNDSSKAASAVVEAGSEAVEATSDAFVETKANIEEGLKNLDKKKKIAEQISNRTTKSINNFENPTTTTTTQTNQITGGGGGKSSKTKRRFFKNKAKSKRVRFAI
jgi:hypothetical protein